jgi:hypothetical protein
MQATCPQCGTTTDVADDSSGQTYPCTHCGKTLTPPSVGNVTPKWFQLDVSWPSLRNGVLFIMLIVGCDAAGIGVSLLLPAVQAAREAGRRQKCSKNLTQIGLAMQSYHQEYGSFPPAFIPDRDGKPKHSWRVLLLPFLGHEGEALLCEYRLDEPWNSSHNMALARRMPSVYRCPADTPPSNSMTSYAMIVGPHAISDGPTSRKLTDITDGPSKTIMMAEYAGANICWLEPRDLDAEQIISIEAQPAAEQTQSGEILNCHSRLRHVLFCNGTDQFLDPATPETTVNAMMTIDGGEIARHQSP